MPSSDVAVDLSEGDVTAASALLVQLLETTYPLYVQYNALGVILAALLNGWIALQSVNYFTKDKSDPWYTIGFISVMLGILYTHFALMVRNLWTLMENYGTFSLVFNQDSNSTFEEMVFYGVLLGPFSLLFVGVRVWKLYKEPFVAGIVGVVCITAMFVSGVIGAQFGFTLPVNTRVPLAEMVASFDPFWAKKLSARLISFLAISIAVNVLLTLLMVTRFRKFSQEDSSNGGVMKMLFRMTFESMLPSAVGNVALGYFLVSGRCWGTWIKTIAHIQPALYVLACMTSVNARSSIQKKLLSNNISINVPRTAPGDHTLDYNEGYMTGMPSSAVGSVAAPMEKLPDEFFDLLREGPPEQRSKSHLGRFVITMGKSNVALSSDSSEENERSEKDGHMSTEGESSGSSSRLGV